MKTKLFFIFTAFCLLALTGCGNGKVQDTVSRVGDDISNTVSRVESALDPNRDTSSGFPDENDISSMPGYSSSQGGGINSGDNDIIDGTGSGIVSDTDNNSRTGNDNSRVESNTSSEASSRTKDM